MSKEEIGTLIVVVLKARNLNDKHTFRKQDVFAKVAFNGTEKKTKVDIKGGQHPVWDDEVRFPVMKLPGGKFRKLEISCWSKEPRDDDLLGKATVDISEIIKTGEFDEWVPLAIDGTIRGDVYLEMTYYAHGPAPPTIAGPVQNSSSALAVPQAPNLMRRPSKMVASERLSRPATNTSQSLPHHGNGSGTSTPFPPHASPSPSPKMNPPLAALPESQSRQNSVGAPLPASLRPGAVNNSYSRAYSDPLISNSPPRIGSYGAASPSPQQNPYLAPVSNFSQHNRRTSTPPGPTSQPNPYLTSSKPTPSSNPYTQEPQQGPAPASLYPQEPQQPAYSQGPQGPFMYQASSPAPVSYTPVHPPASPRPWAGPPPQATSSSFFFPMATVTAAPELEYQPWAGGRGSSRVASPYEPHFNRGDSDPRGDPSLNSRYQTPLPLPSGEAAPSPPRRKASSPPPLPPPPPPPPAPSASPPLRVRQGSPAGPDPRRLVELQRVENEASRRREQEQKDLELAMQLDRELNQ